MKIRFTITRAHLKVASSICSNYTVVWFAALIGTPNVGVLILNIVLAIVFMYLAVKAEEILQEYD